MNTTKLTAKETALLTAIAEGKTDFFDAGLVADSNCWSNVLTDMLTGIVADTARGVASVANSLCRKGLLFSDNLSDDEGASFYITTAGEAWFAEHFPKTPAAAPVQEELEIPVVEEAAPVNAKTRKAVEMVKKHATEHYTDGGWDVIVESWDDAMIAEVLQEAKATTKKAALAAFAPLVGAWAERQADAIISSGETPAEEAGPSAAPEVENHIGFDVETWSENTASHGVEEYIQTKFADGSWTLRRRRNVSGAWRTDFWGQAAGSDKRVFTTSGAAKAARTAGKFTA